MFVVICCLVCCCCSISDLKWQTFNPEGKQKQRKKKKRWPVSLALTLSKATMCRITSVRIQHAWAFLFLFIKLWRHFELKMASLDNKKGFVSVSTQWDIAIVMAIIKPKNSKQRFQSCIFELFFCAYRYWYWCIWLQKSVWHQRVNLVFSSQHRHLRHILAYCAIT